MTSDLPVRYQEWLKNVTLACNLTETGTELTLLPNVTFRWHKITTGTTQEDLCSSNNSSIYDCTVANKLTIGITYNHQLYDNLG